MTTARSSSAKSSPSAPQQAASSSPSRAQRSPETVVGEGRGEKILVFKFKRKKQYKRMQGHRQSFSEVKITDVFVNGTSLKA